MKSISNIFYIALVAGTFLCTLSAHAGVIRKVTPSAETLGAYEMFEVTVSTRVGYKNPYDPENIDVSARIKVPGKSTIVVPAFFTGKRSQWKIRYTPVETGKFSCFIRVKTPKATHNSPTFKFRVTASGRDGFLRRSANNGFYLTFDSGKPFFGLGHNIGWVTDNNIGIYKRYFKDFKKYGCNMTRVWLNNLWTLNIENKKAGTYNIGDSRKLDELLKLAEEYGVYIFLTMDSYGSLMEEPGPWGENAWRTNPYSTKKGGPCEVPEDFFTDPQAKKYYKNRLRYIAARWGYSANILAFDLWNEMDVPKEWALEMTAYLKKINPHAQLITTSLGYPWENNFDETEIWSIQNIDIVQQHIYGNQAEEVTGYLISVGKELEEEYKKPFIVAEFGMDANTNDKKCDPRGLGVALHNSIWAASMSGSLGGAMNWWWAGYVRANNLYPEYMALRKFIEGVNWNAKDVKFAQTTSVKLKVPVRAEGTSLDYKLFPHKKWGDMRYGEFTIDNNGDVAGGVINYYLHGSLKKNIKIDPVFHVDYPKAGTFKVNVGTVSQGGELAVYLDGEEVLSKEYPCGDGEGPWQRSMFRKDHKVYQCYYDDTVSIDVPAGEHAIKLENRGKDWIGLRKVALTNYRDPNSANVRITGMVVGKDILIWMQDKNWRWSLCRTESPPAVISGSFFDLRDLVPGSYKLEWWDTHEGEVLFRETKTINENRMRIVIPEFSKDIACRITKE
ncbi:MAG: DUF5060 domain-containing protein [Candidatus Omnitrophica bacterium]|nr:DUF5060 domain-containing protein [Candidatus Omnitrophota bacterium]